MFKEYDHVRIKDKGVAGDIVDIQTSKNGKTCYLVESDKEGFVDDPDVWNLRYPIFTCTADQLELA